MTEPIRAASPAALLAVVPDLVGLDPVDSLVVVGFRSLRTVAAFRYPLPRPDRRDDAAALVAAAVGTACRIDGVDAVVLAVYTPRRFAGRALPERRFAVAAELAFRNAGFRVLDVFVVAADGWAALGDPATPPGGRPLAELDRHGLPGLPRRGALGRLPARDPQAASRIAAALRRGTPARDFGDAELVDLVERLLAADSPRGATADAADFIRLARSPGRRDGMLLQLAFGRATHAAPRRADAGVRGEPEPFGLAADELARRRSAGPSDRLQAELLLGRSRVRPDPERVRRAHRLLGMLAADAPRRERPPLLTMAGWLAWALGAGSAAGTLFDLALGIEPRYGLAGLLAAWVGRGALPEWVFEPAESSGPGRSVEPGAA